MVTLRSATIRVAATAIGAMACATHALPVFGAVRAWGKDALRVVRRVGVALWAVRALLCVSWLYVDVLLLIHRNQMVWANTRLIATHMMQLMALWNRADEVFVKQSVRLPDSPGVPQISILAVAARLHPLATLTNGCRECVVQLLGRCEVMKAATYSHTHILAPEGRW